MKIDLITLHHVQMRLKSPFETSFGRIESREAIIIEARSDGLLGLGECVADRHPGYSYETTVTAWHIIKDYLAPMAIDTPFDNPDEFQRKMSTIRGHPMAKGGIEMAIWDIYARQQGIPLAEALGGVRDQVEVGVSIGIQSSIPELLNTVSDFLDQGYRRIKIKIKPGCDIRETKAVRQAFPEIPLQVDANSAYTLDSAKRLLPLDDLNLLLIEQPLADDDLWDHHRLQEVLHTPICLDESIQSPRHTRQALEMKACRVINIKAGRVGGLVPAKEIHDICLQAGVPVWCGGMLETGVGRAANLALASLQNFVLPGDISATDRYYDQDITKERFTLNPDSTIDVPNKPGLGVELEPEALKNVRINQAMIKS